MFIVILNFRPTINQEVSVDVIATEELTYITYEILGRGDVLVSKTLPVAKDKSISFKFLGTFAMVPKATLLVYYIREDGEMVSDRIEIKFGDELQNFVSYTYDITISVINL
jgi:CD109 antigen